MQIISLSSVSIQNLTDTFNDAFSQYELPVNLSTDQLSHMMCIRSIDLNLSVGICHNNRLIGFALNGSRITKGKKVAYNSGTGVRINYQQHGLGERLIKESKDVLRKSKHSTYKLEVLCNNKPAIHIYKKAGFQVSRTCHCYEGQVIQTEIQLDLFEELTPTLDLLKSLRPESFNYCPTWQNDHESIINIASSCIVIRYLNGSQSAHGVMRIDSADLMQLTYSDEQAGKMILQYVQKLANGKPIRMINIDAENKPINEFIQRFGLKPTISQYEMLCEW